MSGLREGAPGGDSGSFVFAHLRMSAAEQPGWPKFVEVVGSVFQQWTAFHLAVEQGWGGMSSQQKGEKLLQDTLTFFVQSTPQDPVYADELSDFFEDTLVESFSCDAEDGSCREVADAIVRQFSLCVVNGNFAEADQIIAQAPVAAARALQQSQAGTEAASLSAPDSADTNMEDSAAAAAPAAPVVDEDGFQMVVGKSKGRRQQVHQAAQAPQAQADVAAVQEAQAQRQAQLAAQLAAQQQQALEVQRQQELLAQQEQAQQQMMYEQQQQLLLQQQQEEAARAMAAQAEAEAAAAAAQQPRVLDEI